MKEQLKRVSGYDVKIGQPTRLSIYRESGDLLLIKNRVITSERQKYILINDGFFRQVEIDAENALIKATQKIEQDFSELDQNDIFDVKSRWLAELFVILNAPKPISANDFSYRVLQIATEIQWLCESQYDALLAALHIDHINHYGLVHALHCAVICETIAKGAGLTRIKRLGIIAGALTHDIGIVDIQDELHQQKKALTDEQFLNIRRHPQKGYDKLISLGVDDATWLEIALRHHERLDGSGYPDGLKADQLSLAVKIMAIADIFTALIRPTVFRNENSGKSALAVLFKERGVSLEAKLVNKLIKKIGVYPSGSIVSLANNETAIVTKQGASKSKPLVMVILSAQGIPLKQNRARNTEQAEYKIIGEVLTSEKKLANLNIENILTSSMA